MPNVKTLINSTAYYLLKVISSLKPILREYAKILIVLLLELFLIRIFEFLYLQHTYRFSLSYIKFEVIGIYYDFLFLSLLSLIFVVPFTLLYKISIKASRVFFYILNTLFILTVLILIEYLKNTFVPLDHVIFAYPISELFYIVKESIDLRFTDLVRFILILSTISTLGVLVFQKLSIKLLPIISVFFLLGGIFLTKNLNPARRNFGNNTSFNLSINKLSFLSKSCANYLLGKGELNAQEFEEVASEFQSYHHEIIYDNIRYPLEHSPDTSDYLSEYFVLNEEPPNLVFIIMESLSSAFCGQNAYMGNFTPFLDSLIDQSLYWENFLSTSERTFNAIPSIFGSLPFGEKGFMNLVQNDFSPNHTTLISLLNKNGYQTNFFYGGWTGFDNMEKFLKYQNTDFILKKFNKKYSKIDEDDNGFSWGYPDKQMFQQSLEVLDSLKTNPRLDIYLTLSLHHPFRPPNEAYYQKKFEQLLESNHLNEEQKTEAKQYPKVLQTALYTDEALESFFLQFKKRKEFDNTIFIITGDHRMGVQNSRSILDIYHVPFIIYSPMLKEPAKFSSISSHLNITPTFYPFLSKNWGFEMPDKVHWLGQQIDFSKNFQNNHIIPFMKTNREISDYVSGKYLISGDELYRIKEKLNLIKIVNEEIRDSLNQARSNFILLNEYITKNNLILSDE